MKILVAEDDLNSRDLLEKRLRKWGYNVMAAADGLQAMDVLRENDAPRLVLLDWMMPLMTGIDVCRAVRQQAGKPYCYILMLTGRDSTTDIINGLEAGADDYLIKPVDAMELKARLGTGQRILDLQDQLIAARDKLREQATHDPLTGLWNHGAILEILEQQFARSQRGEAGFGLIMADLDHFKRVNDTHGHVAGDAVLREASRRMLEVLRPYDSLGRYGGEEFMVVVSPCDPVGLRTLAERLRECIEARPVTSSGVEIPITLSLGVATCDGMVDEGVEVLVRATDAALYRAKRGGRNRFEVATPEDGLPDRYPA